MRVRVSHVILWIAIFCLAGLVALPSPRIAVAATVTLVPYGSSGIRYMTYPHDYGWVVTEHPEVYQLGFDDSGWPVGTEPFGSSGPFWPDLWPDLGFCGVSTSTPWGSPDLTIVTRIYVDLPSGFNSVTITGIHACAFYLIVNGNGWGSCEGCFACPRACTCPLSPWSSWFHVGRNLFVVIGQSCYVDEVHYLDFEVTADVTPVGVLPSSWGAIKSLYR
jgi:hypothetical protein